MQLTLYKVLPPHITATRRSHLNLLLATAPNGVAPRKLYTHLQQIVRPIIEHRLSLMHQWNLLTEQHKMHQPAVRNDGIVQFTKVLYAKLREEQEQERLTQHVVRSLPGSFAGSADADAAKRKGKSKMKSSKIENPTSTSNSSSSQRAKRQPLCEAFQTLKACDKGRSVYTIIP